MTIALQTLVDTDRRSVIKGFGVGSETDQVLVDVSALSKYDTTFVMTIAAQDETDFDDVGDNGTFAGGTGYNGAETITLSDGTVITVDAESGNVVTEFTVTSGSTSGFTSLSTLTQASTSGTGTGFTLTTGVNNEAATARVSLVKLGWTIAGGGVLTLEWEGETDVTTLLLGGSGSMNLSYSVGSSIPNPGPAGGTGDLLVNSDGSVTGYSIIAEVHKGEGFTTPSLP